MFIKFHEMRRKDEIIKLNFPSKYENIIHSRILIVKEMDFKYKLFDCFP